MPERLRTRDDRICTYMLGHLEEAVHALVGLGLATKHDVRDWFDNALETVDEPAPGDPGMWWGFDLFGDDDET